MTDDEIEEDIDRLLSHDRLSWLFGAGASFASGLPLMNGLTERILNILGDRGTLITDDGGNAQTQRDFCASVLNEVGPAATVEQLLDQLADYLAMAERSQGKVATTALGKFRTDQLSALRLNILAAIRETVAFGYIHNADPAQATVGTLQTPIVTIEHHLAFMEALFGEVRAGRPRTQCVDIFTLNYDTLIEDSLALSGLPYSDGFIGGAVAYWDPAHFSGDINCVRLMKLHGSIDWTSYRNRRIVRRRVTDQYPDKGSDLLIYPQASKYEFSRREPYDTIFQRFRNRIGDPQGQVLAICGYGFGDRHVDLEIEIAMSKPDSGLTLVVFAKELCATLSQWQSRSFSERLYILTEQNIFRGADKYRDCAPAAPKHDWWTFEGMTKRLRNVRLASGTI